MPRRSSRLPLRPIKVSPAAQRSRSPPSNTPVVIAVGT
jgi:hypothetical protein